MAEARIVKFCVVVGYISSASLGPTNRPRKGRGQSHVTKFKILHPMKYLRNG